MVIFKWIAHSDYSLNAVPLEGASLTFPLQTEWVFDYNFQLYIYVSWLISASLIKSKAPRDKNCLTHYYACKTSWRTVNTTAILNEYMNEQD